MKNSLKNTTEVVPGNTNPRTVPGIVNPRKIPSVGAKSSGLKNEEPSFEINHITNTGIPSNKINSSNANNITNNNNNNSSNNNSNNSNNADQTSSSGYLNKPPSGGTGGVSTANGRPSLPQVSLYYYHQFILIISSHTYQKILLLNKLITCKILMRFQFL